MNHSVFLSHCRNMDPKFRSLSKSLKLSNKRHRATLPERSFDAVLGNAEYFLQMALKAMEETWEMGSSSITPHQLTRMRTIGAAWTELGSTIATPSQQPQEMTPAVTMSTGIQTEEHVITPRKFNYQNISMMLIQKKMIYFTCNDNV